MSRFIAIANQKGGVGKTTTTVNLAASLARFGQRVLVLDMDPQGNTSSGLGVAANALHRGIYEVLMGSMPVAEAITSQASPGVDLLPSGQRLIGAEVELVSALARERILEKGIRPVRDNYDVILADCPPSLGLLTVNTLTAADTVLIPMQCEYYALEGLTQLLNTIKLIQQALNPRLEIEGILLTMFDARLNLSHEVADETRKFFPGRVYETVIPRNVRLSEAPSFGKPVLEYDPECAGAQFYLKLAREILRLPEDAMPLVRPVERPETQAAPEVVSNDAEVEQTTPAVSEETAQVPDAVDATTETEPVHAVASTEETESVHAGAPVIDGGEAPSIDETEPAFTRASQTTERTVDMPDSGFDQPHWIEATHQDATTIALDRDALEVAAIAAQLNEAVSMSTQLDETVVLQEHDENATAPVIETEPDPTDSYSSVDLAAVGVSSVDAAEAEADPSVPSVDTTSVTHEETNGSSPAVMTAETEPRSDASEMDHEVMPSTDITQVESDVPAVLGAERLEEVLSPDDLAEDVPTLPEESIVPAVETVSDLADPIVSNNENPDGAPEPPSVQEPSVQYTDVQPKTEHDAHHPQEELVSHD